MLNYETRVGRQSDIIHAYHAPTTIAISADEKSFYNRADTYFYLNWKPDTTWANAGGSNATVNTRIDQKADAIKALGSKKLFLTIFHEPENDLSPGASNSACSTAAGNSGSTAHYRAMWQNVRNRFDAKGVTNVVWVMNYMGFSGWDCAVKDLWPGNDLVDWIVWDPYIGDGTNYMADASRFYNFLSNNTTATHNFTSKNWGFGEFGFWGKDQAKAYKYYDDMAASVKNNTLPRLKMYVVFDATGINDSRVAFTNAGVADNNEQQKYNGFVNEVLGTVTAPPPPPPPPPADTTPPAGTFNSPTWNSTVSGIVNIDINATDNVGVTKVRFFIDDNSNNVFAEDTTAPYTAQWDSRQVANGTHMIRAKIYDAAGNSKTPLTQVNVSNAAPPAQPVINSFTAAPSTVTVGSDATLNWSQNSATSCSITPNGPVNTTATSWRTPTFTTTGAKNFVLTCKNQVDQTATANVTVNVNPAPTPPAKPIFTSDKGSVQTGGNVTFSWSSAGATDCTLNPGNHIAGGSSGSKLITNIQNSTTYSLSCGNNAGQTAADPITIMVTQTPPPVSPPAIVSFTAEPSQITEGQTSTIKWNTSNVVANGCNLAPTLLTSASSNGQWVTPALVSSVSYTLTCKNANNETVSKSLSVVVSGKPAPPAPPPTSPTTRSTDEAKLPVVSGPGLDEVTNAQIHDETTVGKLITLDPSNITDEEKIKNIVRVEYYNNETLVQTVTEPPYALNTSLLGVGSYNITERVYYVDGSYSINTQTITVKDAPISENEAALATSRTMLPIAIGAVAAVVLLGALGVTAFIFRDKWLPWARIQFPWLDQILAHHEFIASTKRTLHY